MSTPGLRERKQQQRRSRSSKQLPTQQLDHFQPANAPPLKFQFTLNQDSSHYGSSCSWSFEELQTLVEIDFKFDGAAHGPSDFKVENIDPDENYLIVRNKRLRNGNIVRWTNAEVFNVWEGWRNKNQE